MQKRTSALGPGLALAERLTNGPERQSRELALLIARANALRQLVGFNTPETVSALIAAKELADAGVGTPVQQFSALHGLCSAMHAGAQIEPALELAGEMLEVARRQDDPTFRVIGNRLLGSPRSSKSRVTSSTNSGKPPVRSLDHLLGERMARSDFADHALAPLDRPQVARLSLKSVKIAKLWRRFRKPSGTAKPNRKSHSPIGLEATPA
jgi:hypothetical protein